MAAINVNRATYKVNAAILPANATDKSLAWSITGPASIDNTGLVTAEDNGTAIVTAMAKDGSGISGTLSIIITNQKVLVTSIILS
jgi:uncharacterized protein YjdB